MQSPDVKLTKTVTVHDAKSFLDAISPIGPYLFGSPMDRWIFRGESSDSFVPLVPSALRPGNRRRLIDLSRIGGENLSDPLEEWRQISAELLLLQRFFEATDRAGLPLPEDRQEIRMYLQDAQRAMKVFQTPFSETWLPNELLSLAGLAQHYGLPTRLLDWTRDGVTAAYFAAKSALQSDRQGATQGLDECLVVWALRESAVYDSERLREDPTRGPLLLVTAPAAANPNLRAQQGLFTLWRPDDYNSSQPVNRKPLNVRFVGHCAASNLIDQDSVFFYQFKLPLASARDLFRNILALGISAGKLFPDFQGAAESLQDISLAFDH